MTPFILLNNIAYYLGTLRLQPPRVAAIGVPLTNATIIKIQPYTRDIVERIGLGEKPEHIAQSVAIHTGVTVEQAMLYMAPLARTSNQSIAQCWKCKTPIKVTPEIRGKKVRCPSCRTKQEMPV